MANLKILEQEIFSTRRAIYYLFILLTLLHFLNFLCKHGAIIQTGIICKYDDDMRVDHSDVTVSARK